MIPTIAGAAPPVDVANVVAADDASLAVAGILFPADPVGMLSLTDQDGTLSPTDLAGILFPADPAGILFPADIAEPVTINARGCCRCRSPRGSHDPCDLAVIPGGGRFLGALGVAATGVAVGVAVVSSNRRAQTHHHLHRLVRDCV